MATVVEAAGIIRVVAALAGRVVQALVPVAALADDPVPGSIWTARNPHSSRPSIMVRLSMT
ncbi:hypothetical protein PSCICP_14760 [Pseudomonas cichorii]|uniref:Uncharacterized protein n=1 Tax=Pseudomonas cichorii TaxID=36746 RepID=A0ABQ1DKP2_PSECI|nr:hypothetical protein PSCICP_14760 [Pseudomonas cichorii]